MNSKGFEALSCAWSNLKMGTCRLLVLLTYSMVQDIIWKVTVTQHVEKYPAVLWNPKVHYRVHKSSPVDPILSQLNPVRPIDPFLRKVHLNVILPPTPRSSQLSLAFSNISLHFKIAMLTCSLTSSSDFVGAKCVRLALHACTHTQNCIIIYSFNYFFLLTAYLLHANVKWLHDAWIK
jgi:hypothetical protein